MLAVVAYQLDLFKKPLSLKIKSNFLVSTWLGFIVSLGVFAAIFLSFFQSNMISKTNPNVIEKTSISKYSQNQTLGKNTLFIAGLSDGLRNFYVDDTIFTIEVFLTKLIGSSPRVFMPLPTIKCRPEFTVGFETFTSGFEKTDCLLNTEVEIYGNQFEGQFQSLTFNLRVCNNATDNNICKSEAEIVGFLKDKIFTVTYPDYNYDIDNFEIPYNLNFKTVMVSDLLTKAQWIGMSMKASHYKSDDNVILSEEKETILPIFDFKEAIVYPIVTTSQVLYFNNQITPLSMIYFQSSTNVHYISRRYQKLQEVLANMSGIANTLITVGMVLTALESKMQLLSTIIKNLYSFKPKRKHGNRKKKDQQNDQEKDQERNIPIDQENNTRNKNKKEPIFIKQEIALSKLKSNEVTDSIKMNEVTIQVKENEQTPDVKNKIKQKYYVDEDPLQESQEDNPSEIDSAKKLNVKSNRVQKEYERVQNFENFYHKVKQPKNVQINSKSFFMAKIKKQFKRQLTEDQEIILKAEEVFEKEIDFVTILQKLQEIEKLKFILLSPHQLSLFNLLAKPTIDINNDEESNSMVIIILF